jgi:two-component system response regulator MprA
LKIQRPTVPLVQQNLRLGCNAAAMRILVVDDEHAVRDALGRALRLDGYDVELAASGDLAMALIDQRCPDALILDVLMPGTDGLDLCRQLRAQGNRTPVLMLTARDAITDRISGLDAGADDYLVKPFALGELQARLRALLRRTTPDPESQSLSYLDVELDRATREVHRGERLIELTRTEFLLLELFLLNPRQVLERATIFERVWGFDFGPSSNSLEVYVGYLRRKLEAAGEPRMIQTVHGVGYVLREPRDTV